MAPKEVRGKSNQYQAERETDGENRGSLKVAKPAHGDVVPPIESIS